MSFSKQAALATVVIASCVGGLVLLGRSGGPTPSAEAPALAPSVPRPPPSTSPPGDVGPAFVAPPPGLGGRVRNLIPPNAWLVADFRGDLTGQGPFADQEGLCQKVPAPARVALAVMPPAPGQSPDLLIAAREVEDTFWGCARDRIINAGGVPLAQNERYEVLKSPSGLVARGPGGSMVFLTSETHLEGALAVLSDLSPGSASSGPHAGIYGGLFLGVDLPRVSDLDVTLSLPTDWLSSVGQDSEKSPLRFIRSAFVGVNQDGSAQGGVICDEAGCAEVLAFLERARTDALVDLPPGISRAVESSLKATHVPGAGRITIQWSPSSVSLLTLLQPLLGGGAVLGSTGPSAAGAREPGGGSPPSVPATPGSVPARPVP